MAQQLYARVFTQILDSSLADNWQTRHVFEDLLKLADNGVVDMTRQAIARRTNVPIDVINAALTELENPDPASRDAAEEGRRIIRLDEHRDWGWLIVNWQKYEEVRSTADQRTKTRGRVQRHREKSKQPLLPSSLPSPAPEAEAEAEAERALPRRYTPLHEVTKGMVSGIDAAASDSSHQLFIRLWTEAFMVSRGLRYFVQGGKDGAAVKRLLAGSSKSPEELVAIARHAWANPDGFYCKQAVTIAGFASRYNEILAESTPQTPRPKTILDREMERITKRTERLRS